MDVSSDESSYSAESMGSFDGQEWERFAGRRACSLVLSIYREKLLADGQLANRAITLSLDQQPSVLVDQDNLAIMNWAEQHLDAGHLELFRLVFTCWKQLFRSVVSEQMRRNISVLADHPRFPSRRWLFRSLGPQLEMTLGSHRDRALVVQVVMEMRRIHSNVLLIDGLCLYLCTLPEVDRYFPNHIHSRLGFPPVWP